MLYLLDSKMAKKYKAILKKWVSLGYISNRFNIDLKVENLDLKIKRKLTIRIPHSKIS